MDSITEYYENNLDSTIDIDGTIDYSRGYVRHNLFLPYKTLQSALRLDEKMRAVDEMLLNAAHSAIEHYTGRILSLRRISEDSTVENGTLIPRENPVKSVISLVDTETQEDAALDAIEIFPNLINLGTHDYDTHVCRLTYVAGYASGEGASELAEAVIKTFLMKRHWLYREIAESLDNKSLFADQELSAEIKNLLAPFKR